jgi:hypothetical protein
VVVSFVVVTYMYYIQQRLRYYCFSSSDLSFFIKGPAAAGKGFPVMDLRIAPLSR